MSTEVVQGVLTREKRKALTVADCPPAGRRSSVPLCGEECSNEPGHPSELDAVWLDRRARCPPPGSRLAPLRSAHDNGAGHYRVLRGRVSLLVSGGGAE